MYTYSCIMAIQQSDVTGASAFLLNRIIYVFGRDGYDSMWYFKKIDLKIWMKNLCDIVLHSQIFIFPVSLFTFQRE